MLDRKSISIKKEPLKMTAAAVALPVAFMFFAAGLTSSILVIYLLGLAAKMSPKNLLAMVNK